MMNGTMVPSLAVTIFSVLGASIFSTMPRSAAGEPTTGQPPPAVVVPGKYVDQAGNIRLPEDYRLKWTHMGSWQVADATGKNGQMHDVYAEPDAVEEFQKTGKWPQGATLVKEIRSSRTGKMTTGIANWDGEIKEWFVMVKDNKRTFPGNANWGRGWGWGLYGIDDPKKNTSTDYKVDCLGCHVPAEKTDWIYVHGYPVLFEKNGPFKKYAKELYEGNEPLDKPTKSDK